MARVLVTLSESFLKEVDSLADTSNRSRSEYVREAIRSYLRHKKQNNILNSQENASELEQLLD